MPEARSSPTAAPPRPAPRARPLTAPRPLADSALTGNRAGAGGGLFVSGGALYLTRATVAGNQATQSEGGFGGGVAALATEIWLVNSTLTGNSAALGGGYVGLGLQRLENTTITDNTAPEAAGAYIGASGGDGEVAHSSAVVSGTIVAGNHGGPQCEPQDASFLVATY